jgi:hypothetical protein
MSVFKFLSFLFPFIKEMVLGDKTVKEALKTNKTRVLVLVLILASFAMNFWLVPKIIRISAYAVSLEHKLDDAKDVPAKPTPASQPALAKSEDNKPPDATAPPEVAASEADGADTPLVQQAVTQAQAKAPRTPTVTKVHPLPRPKRPAAQRDDSYDEWKKSFDTIRSREEDASRAGPAYPGPAQAEEIKKLYHHH